LIAGVRTPEYDAVHVSFFHRTNNGWEWRLENGVWRGSVVGRGKEVSKEYNVLREKRRKTGRKNTTGNAI